MESQTGSDPAAQITPEELRLATRNHGMPLEALRHAITPTGLHYLLIHYDIPQLDAAAFRLDLGGRVRRPISLSLDDLRARPQVTLPVTMECAGNGRAHLEPRPISQPWLSEAVGTAEWTGTSLAGVLDQAGLLGDAVEVLFTGLDRGIEGDVEQRYERSLPVSEALDERVLLAYGMNGDALPPQHGHPLRLVVPGWYGMTSVKWLAGVTALSEPWRGYQQEHAYRVREREEDPGEPVTRMMPRSLMAPPGIPEFATRERFLALEPCELRGRAWSGWGPVERVEVSVDGGASWEDAQLEEPVGPTAWRGWRHRWAPSAPGRYELCSRAGDAAGNIQPARPPWNLGGYVNNAIERVTVTVGGGGA